MSDGWSSFMDSTPLGGFFDSGQANKKAGQADVNSEAGNYSGIATPTFTPVQQQTAQVGQAGPNAFNGISTNPAYTQAQTQQMAALSNLAANGGRNAQSDANLANIQQSANANAQGQRGAIMQQAAQRGQSGSGNSLLAALSAQQGDISNQNAQDLGVAGQEANTAIQAGQGAAGIGSNLQNTEFGEQAAAANAQNGLNEFNAGQTTQGNEFNAGQGNQISALNNYNMPQASFQDAMGKAQGESQGDQNAANWNTQQQGAAAKKQSGLWSSAADLGGSTDTGSGLMDSFQSLAFGGPVTGMGGASDGVQSPKAPAAAPIANLGGLSNSPMAKFTTQEARLSALKNFHKKAMGG